WVRLLHDALFFMEKFTSAALCDFDYSMSMTFTFTTTCRPPNARSPCVPAWASGGAAPAHLAGANGLRRIEGIAR
ncbi:hypothetical protein, partial [Azonexus hydrophilus]|uniref:hypothetical protein n=1 Tax=Azonexus hydrophilus TaxID=418702 RepID=UPI0019667BE0